MLTKRSPFEDELDLELLRHARLLHVLRTRVASRVPTGTDLAAFGVLKALIHHGANRQGALAEVVGLDPSTTSRYVGQLTRAGLVERQRDPDDGRAVQLAATQAGQDLVHQLATHRQSVMAAVLADWSTEDLTDLHRLIKQLNDSIESLRDCPAVLSTSEQESSHGR